MGLEEIHTSSNLYVLYLIDNYSFWEIFAILKYLISIKTLTRNTKKILWHLIYYVSIMQNHVILLENDKRNKSI